MTYLKVLKEGKGVTQNTFYIKYKKYFNFFLFV